MYTCRVAPTDAVNPVTIEAMAERGIDISREFPKPWTDETVRAADVVVTMGCGDACPVFPGKRYENWGDRRPARRRPAHRSPHPRRHRAPRARPHHPTPRQRQVNQSKANPLLSRGFEAGSVELPRALREPEPEPVDHRRGRTGSGIRRAQRDV
ncbi:hypothetical protein [Granulicoccus sp. GXG6511]|uniref:hypothetical protein n=1 Tax=Granulicoccus sp. GXG6511 TaxID=3381351 RepID=UPI003D7DC446